MAKKLSPRKLRDQAKALMEKARLEEEKLYIQVGKLVEKKLLNNDFNPSELGKFITQVRQILHD